MYQVIAKLKSYIGKEVQPYWIAKVYKSLKNADRFLEKQKNHTKFYFIIEKVA